MGIISESLCWLYKRHIVIEQLEPHTSSLSPLLMMLLIIYPMWGGILSAWQAPFNLHVKTSHVCGGVWPWPITGDVLWCLVAKSQINYSYMKSYRTAPETCCLAISSTTIWLNSLRFRLGGKPKTRLKKAFLWIKSWF